MHVAQPPRLVSAVAPCTARAQPVCRVALAHCLRSDRHGSTRHRSRRRAPDRTSFRRRCDDAWCWVDPAHCDVVNYPMANTLQLDDTSVSLHWSYEACDSEFGGNSWVGMPPSPPAAASACPCIDTSHLFSGLIRPRDWASTCQTWDNNRMGFVDFNDGACTGAGAPDWCSDAWCYVDPNNCNLPSFESNVAKVRAAGLHFSYKTCNEGFTGNSYVGHCQCLGHTGAFDGTTRPVNWGGVCESWNVQDGKWPACVSANPPDW